MYELDPAHHHFLGIELNNQTWALLDKPDRTELDQRRLVALAHGALHHWHRSPTFQPANAARGHWMISRVHAVLEQLEPAREHARACLALCEEHDLKDFDRAYAYEATARACALAGELDEARSFRSKAANEPISDPGDKSHFDGDLAAGPWFGLVEDRN